MKKTGRRVQAKDLVDKIEKITRERMAKEKVVDLGGLRELRARGEPAHILVIDDDETIREGLRRILEADGHRVLCAADGTQLSDLLDGQWLDMILLDIGLPWINGFELAELMRGHPDLKDLPIIFISGRTSDDDIKRSFKSGADDFIKKPFDIDKLRRAVRTLLKLSAR